MIRNPKRLHLRFSVEWVLATTVVLALLRVVYLAYTRGYLPQPFFYEPSDTFADWFNPSHWAGNAGTYDTYRALYPPISFVFQSVFRIDICYDQNAVDFSAGLAARSCDWAGIGAIFGLWILNILLVYLSYRKWMPERAVVRTIAVALGFPMLNAVERGNLVLVTFACMVLAWGPMLRSSTLRMFFAGCAINFKVYMLAALLPLILKRDWHRVELGLICTAIVYLVTYAILGRGSLFQIAENIAAFSDLVPQTPLDVWMVGSYAPMVQLIKNDNFPSVLILGSDWRDFLVVLLPALIRTAQATILLAFVTIALRPEVIPRYRVIALGILFAEISSETGAYAIMFHTFFVLMEPWRGAGRKLAIIICYLTALAIEIPIQDVAPVTRDSYIAQSSIVVNYYVGLTPFLRPATTILVGVILALVTIGSVFVDVRHQGWSNRSRFHRDLQPLPWVKRPAAPTKRRGDSSPLNAQCPDADGS